MDAEELFESVLRHVEENYTSYNFYCERDIVWTLQKEIWEQIRINQLPFRVFHEYPFDETGGKPAIDLAILDLTNKYPVRVALELKYEPDHNRQGKNIRPDKYEKGKQRYAVFWPIGVQQDISRTNKLIDEGKAEIAYSIFIDEGDFWHSTIRHGPRLPLASAEWIQWKPIDTSLSPWVHRHKRNR